jgi:hypothetical protein
MKREDFFAAVSVGRPISFSQGATNADRSIDPLWIHEALTSAGNCILIENGLITGGLSIYSQEIPNHLSLRACTLATVNVRYCTVCENFDLSGSTIAALDLRGTTFGRALWLRETTVADGLRLDDVTVATLLDLDGLVAQSSVYAYGVNVGKNVHMRGSRFEGKAVFSLLTSGGQLDLKDAVFENDLALQDAVLGGLATEATSFSNVAFERAEVRSSTFLLAQRVGFLNCHSMKISGQLVIKGVEVKGLAMLEAVECIDMCLEDCTFSKDVSIIGANVINFSASHCKFGGSVRMNDFRCDALVGFSDCDGKTFHFDRARIGGTVGIGAVEEERVTVDSLFFFGATIGAQLNLERILIRDKLVLESSRIAGDFRMIDGSVLGGLYALGLKVDGTFAFDGSLCGGPAEFTDAVVGKELTTRGSVYLSDVRFWRVAVYSFADCRDAIFECGASFEFSQLGTLILYDVISLSTLSLKDAVVGSLHFDRVLNAATAPQAWPFSCTDVELSGCRYNRLSVAWRNMLNSLKHDERSFSNRQPFFELERFMRSIGRDDWADEVYYCGRASTGDRMGFSWAWLEDRASRYLSGYGVRPRRLLLCVVGIVLGLILLYSAPNAVRPAGTAPRHFNCTRAVRSPDIIDRIGLAMISLSPSPKVVDGWTISDCSLSAQGIPLGKPFFWVGLAQVFALILVPFLIATFTKVLNYGRREV